MATATTVCHATEWVGKDVFLEATTVDEETETTNHCCTPPVPYHTEVTKLR